MNREEITFIFEMLAAVAFGFSGAFLAIRKGYDLLGVITLAVITTVGGGLMRDLIIGKIPPAAFVHPSYVIAGMSSALLSFLYFRFLDNKVKRHIFHRIAYWIDLFDAIGLGLYTMLGVQTAAEYWPKNPFLVISVGVLTGVGGGLLRDILSRTEPYIFKKELYAIPSILGATLFYYTRYQWDYNISYYGSAVFVFMIRMLALKYKIRLPAIQYRKMK